MDDVASKSAIVQERPELSEILGSLSLAEDLANGNPSETALRTALIAARLAEAQGFDEAQRRKCCLAALVRFLGCTSFASEEAATFFDDQEFKRTFGAVDSRNQWEMVRRGASVGKKSDGGSRLRGGGRVLWGGRPFFEGLVRSQCETAGILARSLGLEEAVCRSVEQIYEHFDGAGHPHGRSGSEIQVEARVAAVAYTYEIVRQQSNSATALVETGRRSGAALDPRIVAALPGVAAAAEGGTSVWEEVMAALAPTYGSTVREVAAAFANFADIKSRYSGGHSARVARLVRAAAGVAGMEGAARDTLEIAALLMNIGMVSVSNSILDKPGPLSRPERSKIELHTFYTDKLLECARAFGPFAQLAVSHHERPDGSGYHRRAREISFPMALLSAADCFVALSSGRAHRAAFSADAIENTILKEAAAGKREARSTRIVLEAAGIKPRRDHGERDRHGLTERELTVLRLVAQGLSNKRIGQELGLSPRTVQHHTIRIYEKLGVSSRAAATLHASRSGLVD